MEVLLAATELESIISFVAVANNVASAVTIALS